MSHFDEWLTPGAVLAIVVVYVLFVVVPVLMSDGV